MTSTAQRFELVGVAGSGKSSLLEALLSSDRKFVNGWRFRNPWVAVATVKTICRYPHWWVGAVLLRPRLDRTSLWGLATMVIQGELLTLRNPAPETIILYDQGAVFSIAMLEIFGSASENRYVSKIIQSCMSRWSQGLDGIIFVDAADDVLFERIHARAQEHRMINKDSDAVARFLGRYRSVFEVLLDDLNRFGDVPVLRLRTDELDPAETLSRSLAFLNSSSRASK